MSHDDDFPADEDGLGDDSPELELLLSELRTIALSGNFNVDEAVCRSKARNVLEATAGDVLTAAQLYWDDFLATRLQNGDGGIPFNGLPDELQDLHGSDEVPAVENPKPRRSRRDEARSGRTEQDAIDIESPEAAEDESFPGIGSLRRRLFSATKRTDAGARGANAAERRRKEAVVREIRARRNNPDVDNESDDEAADQRIVNVGNESVSVSDDEAILRGRSRRLLDKLKGKQEDELASSKRRKLLFGQLISDDANEDDDGYLSENDWLCDSLVSRDSIPLSDPVDLLWGYASAEKRGDTSTAKAPGDTSQGKAPDGAQNVIIAADDKSADDGANAATGIPRTWLNAGFQLVAVKENVPAVGFAARPPNENDLAYFCWKHQQDNDDNTHAPVPLPYHCRSVTALLSIVTSMMYTGATLQSSGHISCSSSRTPFSELTSSEGTADIDLAKLTRELDARLVDALSTLLHIAAKASTERKQKALQAFRMSKDPEDQVKWQKIKRKLKLVPTCSWTKDPSGDVVLPSLSADGVITCTIPVAVSYTNIEDLRSYVISNLRSFKSSGGCALLLETIVRIHGQGAVARMVRRSRKAAGCGSDLKAPLVHCTCDTRHLAKLDADPVLAQKLKTDAKNRIVSDTTPDGHDCFSVDLLSLILTGEVHATLQGWSTAPLGLGILSNVPNQVGRGLTRPEKPVWILRGPTCYSVLWLNGSNDHAATFSRIDHPGAVASFTHWNGWYSGRNASKFRLVANRSEPHPTMQTVSDDEDVTFEQNISTMTATLQSLARKRRHDLVVANDCTRLETVDADLIVTPEEMDRVVANQEDQKFYPNQYQIWRYDMGEDSMCLDRKAHAPHWRPFFSLSKREKLVVESKLGPQICTVLWTRWPRATVDQLVPERPPPVV